MYPGPSVQCCMGVVVCGVEEIEISTLFRGEGTYGARNGNNFSYFSLSMSDKRTKDFLLLTVNFMALFPALLSMVTW